MQTEKRRKFAASLLRNSYDKDYRKEVIAKVLSGEKRENTDVMPVETGINAARENEICTPSVCFACHSTCEVLVYTDKESGKVLRVEGDPSSPQTRGVLCSKGLASPDLCYNPKRLLTPLKRVGERGEGKFEPISWEEALGTTAKMLTKFKNEQGAQSVALLEGTRRGWSRVYSRFANVFGTPNNGAAGWAQCLWPRLTECNITFGGGAQYTETQDYPNADCIVCWGINPATCWGVRASDIMRAKESGAALIVVDPYLSETAAKADIWLNIRPDTDMALALAMINIIIEENLIDAQFVAEYTFGFEELAEHVKEYTPKWAEKITGVSAEKIIKATHLYAKSAAASLVRCLAVDQLHDSIQVCRAISILISITGNIGKPGSNNLTPSTGVISQNTHDFVMANALPKEMEKLRSGYDEFPLLTQKFSPVPTGHMPTMWEQIISKDPYPISAAMIFGSNAVVSYTNSDKVEEAIKSLDFLAVADMYMTPTAELADIIFPVSTWLERTNIISSFQTDNCNTLIEQPVTQIGDTKNDVDIIIELANRLGLSEYFWENSKAMYDYLLSPLGIDFDEAVKRRRLYAPMKYYRYKDTQFKTPSGKIELYSTYAKEMGSDPLPRYTPSFQSKESTPELYKEYPITMTTGRHETAFRISENRLNPHLLELSHKPWIEIHPDTAKEYGIPEGGRVKIETKAGTAYAYARYTLGIEKDVVQTISGWWGEYNINKTVPWGEYSQGVGSVCARGYLCKISADL